MSSAIAFKHFTLYFIIYIVVSLVVYLMTSISSLGWIIAFFTLLPFYSLCGASILSINLKNRNATVKFYKFLLLPIFIFQLTKILSSPASCYGWSQGKSCYSFIQALLSNENLNSFSENIAHWEIVESVFPVALVLYIISTAAFLISMRIQNFTDK